MNTYSIQVYRFFVLFFPFNDFVIMLLANKLVLILTNEGQNCKGLISNYGYETQAFLIHRNFYSNVESLKN